MAVGRSLRDQPTAELSNPFGVKTAHFPPKGLYSPAVGTCCGPAGAQRTRGATTRTHGAAPIHPQLRSHHRIHGWATAASFENYWQSLRRLDKKGVRPGP